MNHFLCVCPMPYFMLNKMMFAELLILCTLCDLFLCVLEDKTIIQFALLHNIRTTP